MRVISVFKWLELSTPWVYRTVTWAALICILIFTLIVGGVRFWLLPNIGSYREAIARELSAATKHHITIGKLEGRWSGLNLQMTLGNLVLFDKIGQPALKLDRIDSTLSWWSLVLWDPQFDSIEIDGPALSIRRDAQGVISIAGIELSSETEGGGLSDWLLRQDTIVIRNAAITWQDAMREAPELVLNSVDFRLDNSGKHHRFGLRAVPPEQLATPLDLRGVLEGRTVKDLVQWNGQLFAQLDHTDIAAWHSWVPFPVAFPHGTGGLRAWLTLRRGEPAEIIADVRLSQVNTQVDKSLPALGLAALSGRVAWKQLKEGYEVNMSKLGMTMPGGLALQPVDFQLRVFNESGRNPGHGEFAASALDLEPLRAISDRLPIDADLRKGLETYAPRGSVHDLSVKWKGSWPTPAQYSLKGRFANLGINATGHFPGFSGASGEVEATERGGTLALNTQNAEIELPLVFQEKLKLDVLNSQLRWQRAGDTYEFKLGSTTFSNPDLSGSVSGTYQTVPGGRGMIDLSGSATRAEARSVGRYLPLQIGKRARQWLVSALQGGISNDVKLRLKGNLDDFPFSEGKSGGIFQVTARVNGGTLDYVPSWPKIENISADLNFHGRRMEVVARSATILGAKLSQVRAEIPDLETPNHLLTVSGDAQGATSEFLKFIEQSPVKESIDNFTDGLQAQGSGQLALKLTIPLANSKDIKVAGTYTLNNNQLQDNDIPFALEQVNGRMEFTEASIRVPFANMMILGGAATLNAATQSDGITRVNMAGRANMDNVRKSQTAPFFQTLQGATDWKAAISFRKRYADIILESTLQGVSSELPAPFSKAAPDIMPLRLERQFVSGQSERLTFSIGNIISGQLLRRKDGAQYTIERGNVSLGGNAAVPERNGVWLTGGLRSLDLDRWLALLKNVTADGNSIALAGVDVKFGTLDIFGRRFNELAISGSAQGGNWPIVLVGRELVGELQWRPQGKGKVTAHMKNLVIPAATPSRLASSVQDKESPFEYPALDIVADQFQVNDKNLGKLELSAVQDGRDWKLERLRVVNPDATLNIEGLWQGWLSQPRTMVNVKLEVNDIGKFLIRLGYPEGVRRGTAKLEGPLSWAGNPADLDYATLGGNFVVEAAKGQFVKLDPGVGKLLGILSLQSLPRRLTLDFRDIFSDGLAFNEILGSVKVNRGVANTENFRIQGPAVRILMSGDVDLHAETQKLRVKVFPSVSDGLSVAGALISGPVAGIASFLVQKILKNPLDQMAAYEYSVTGPWTDPQVAKVSSGQEQAAEKAK